MRMWGLNLVPFTWRSMTASKTRHWKKAPHPGKEGLGGHTLCASFRSPLASPLPEASSTAGAEAASAAEAPCRWSSARRGRRCLQRGIHSSGTYSLGPRSPVWGAGQSPPSHPSALPSFCRGKMTIETCQGPRIQTPQDSLLLLKRRADVQLTHFSC